MKDRKSNAKISLVRFFLMLLLIRGYLLSAQTAQRIYDLKNQEPSWYAVIGGNAVSSCIDTSYGIALLSDGRMLSACTNDGKVIWQKRVKGRPSPYITPFGDFLFVVTDRSHVNLINPSGLTLWTAVSPFEVTDFPQVARDGRVFVRGKKGLACFGLDGKRKWHTVTDELGELPIGMLDDGSIIVFLKSPKNNLTVANRFSPFGEKLEDITFSGIVSSAENSEKGVLVSLKNGSLGLVTVQDGTADSKWVNGSGNTAGAFKICYSSQSGNTAFFFQNGIKTEAVIVQTDSGEILNRFQVGNIASKDFKIAKATESGFFISGAYSACEFGEDGIIFYAASLPPSEKWNSIFYTGKNYLVLCMKDWTMKAYHMNSLTKNQVASKKSGKIKSISFIDNGAASNSLLFAGIRPLSNQKMSEISKALDAGDYGEKEREYLSLLKIEAQNYIQSNATKTAFSSRAEENYFLADAVYTQNLLYLLSKTGTREFSQIFARILSGDVDESQILSAITFAGDTGYDENGEILLAFENLLLKRIPPSENILLKAVCDSTYKICSFMGRPAIIRRGKDILTQLFLPQYDKSINDYARKTLEKMVVLEKKR